MMDSANPEARPRVPLTQILVSFVKLGSSTFGGGNAAWMQREVVERRKWIAEDKFLQMLAIAQVLPGANPVNLAVYVGVHLGGFWGAVMASIGMIAVPFAIIIILGLAYHQLAIYPQAQAVLGGLACVGIASMLMMGIKSARRLKLRIVPILIAIVVFVAVGVLRLPMTWTLAVAIPISVIAHYILDGNKTDGH